jgi:hypothetical protein
MRVFDPNAYRGDNWANAFFDEPVGFEMWIREWAPGVDLSDLMFRRA